MVATMNVMAQKMETRTALPHIMVVDSDPDSTLLLARALGPHFRFTTARNSEEAIYLLANQPFDLILLDVTIRKVSQPDVLAAIRENPETATVPVILVSSLSQRQDVLRGLESGANDYVTKPFDLDVLKARIKNQMETKRLLDERQQMIAHLRNAHEIKDRLLRIVTHDLKNPLNSIRLAEYYLRGTVGNDPEATEALDAIEDTVNTINEIIEGFLDSAALEFW